MYILVELDMLFNSYDFLFLFLLPVFVGYLMFVKSSKINKKYLLYFFILVSLVFYGQWNLEHLGLLLTSVFVNYFYAYYMYNGTILRDYKTNSFPFYYLVIIVILNLLPLMYYKYSGFLSMSKDSLILPLAISFFTFQQIAFQVDLYKGKIDVSEERKKIPFSSYMFFILFFPQLIAGPIVHYNELMNQVKRPEWLKFNKAYFTQGVLLFSIGLFKKVVLADTLAVFANNSFSSISSISTYDAWVGLFAYSFEIYFDFSGYADMAIGLALLFGLKLPANFLSPYKSKNIIEFWRRWHITLSNFLKDHLYIPLGGNRLGLPRAIINLLVTMSIGGIWHGAGWTFLLWGFFHGVLLGIVHLLGSLKNKINSKNEDSENSASIGFAIFFTFVSVTLLWVLFRADSFDMAMRYYELLFSFTDIMPKKMPELTLVPFSIGKEYLVLMAFFIVWFLPNSLEFTGYVKDETKVSSFSMSSVFISALLVFISLKVMASTPAKTFVYFNF